jgi:hypothetical protein
VATLFALRSRLCLVYFLLSTTLPSIFPAEAGKMEPWGFESSKSPFLIAPEGVFYQLTAQFPAGLTSENNFQIITQP